MHKEKKIVKEGVRTFKFSNGNKLNSLYKVTLRYVIAEIEVSIITDVVDSDIPLLLRKDSMKRAGTCLNFENDSITMFKRKFHWDAHCLDITTSLSPNIYQTKVSSNTYFLLKKSPQKKLKWQQSYIDNLVILVRNYVILLKMQWKEILHLPKFSKYFQIPLKCVFATKRRNLGLLLDSH